MRWKSIRLFQTHPYWFVSKTVEVLLSGDILKMPQRVTETLSRCGMVGSGWNRNQGLGGGWRNC
jgi:hypothetical protein